MSELLLQLSYTPADCSEKSSQLSLLVMPKLSSLSSKNGFKKNSHIGAIKVVRLLLMASVVIGAAVAGYVIYSFYSQSQTQIQLLSVGEERQIALSQQLEEVEQRLTVTAAELDTVKAEDQFKKNQELMAEIKNIQTTYKDAAATYEDLLKLKEDTTKAQTQTLDADFSQALVFLSQRNYASASTRIARLKSGIAQQRAQLATVSTAVPANVATNNTPPGSGYSRQAVENEFGRFLVDIVAADLNSTRVVVETASSGDCGDGCPVDSLGSFVAKAGGFAGINGPYFCPAEYPSCAGKTNSFDTLLMNKNKTYFNSDNNVYSNVPAVIFQGSSARFVGASSEWGRDTGPDSVIASQPMLLSGGEVRFGGDGDPKKGSRGSRSFIGNKGNTVYIGVVRNATVAEVARVLKTMGLENALNLDSGGSTAMMVNGRYIAGPGRNTPFGIVLVRK